MAASAEPDVLATLPNFFSVAGPLAAGHHLYHAGDQAGTQFHLRSGMIKTYTITAEGDEFVTGFHLPGAVLGIAQTNNCQVESAVALDTATACCFDKASIAALGTIDMINALVKQMSLQDTERLLHQTNLRQASAQARFAGFCCLYADRLRALGRCPTLLPTPMSRTDIASYLGMTLESLSRVVSKLHKANIVVAQRYQITLNKPDVLQTLRTHRL